MGGSYESKEKNIGYEGMRFEGERGG